MRTHYLDYHPRDVKRLMDLKKETKEYLKYVKSHPCTLCGATQVDADHLIHRGMGGVGAKGKTHTGTLQDFTCVPLCRQHHTERHSLGIKGFDSKYKINLWKEAFLLLRSFYVE